MKWNRLNLWNILYVVFVKLSHLLLLCNCNLIFLYHILPSMCMTCQYLTSSEQKMPNCWAELYYQAKYKFLGVLPLLASWESHCWILTWYLERAPLYDYIFPTYAFYLNLRSLCLTYIFNRSDVLWVLIRWNLSTRFSHLCHCTGLLFEG